MNIPNDTSAFIQRWFDKATAYTTDNIEDYFDRFFSFYVLYNFLYVYVNAHKNYGKNKDSEASNYVARKFLGSSAIYGDKDIQIDGSKIYQLISDNTFYVRDYVWDKSKVDKLQLTDPDKWSEGLLEIIYGIRCNLFHGSKSFSVEQKTILEPCINILGRICIMMIQEMGIIGAVDTSRYSKFSHRL